MRRLCSSDDQCRARTGGRRLFFPDGARKRADFVVDVAGERFVLRLTDAETIALAEGNRLGRNSRFPLGPLRAGNGGFNAPWTWHLDPSETRLVELAIELCDGRPSYVEEHKSDYPTYCPWGARVVGRR